MGQDAVAAALYTDPTGLLKTRVVWCCRCCGVVRRAIDMLGKRERRQAARFVAGRAATWSRTTTFRVDRVLELSWLPEEVADGHGTDDGRPGIDPRSRRA